MADSGGKGTTEWNAWGASWGNYPIVSINGAAPAKSIVQGTGADWFGPLNPLIPIAPPEVKGRQFDYQSGYNVVTQPRASEQISFWMLRELANSDPWLRTIIETRKDQMSALRWTIKPKFTGKVSLNREPTDPRVLKVLKFFEKPDGGHYWDEWLRMLLEDLFVIDAPVLWKERTRAGDLYRVHVMDGALFKRVIDDWGRTPEPPVPAYQQVLKQLPAVNYTTDEIEYMARNIRANRVYGFGPVEQIVLTVNTALRKQIFQLQYYTEGNIPEALIGVPDSWQPSQIRQFQDDWDARFAGNTGARRHAKFVPGGIAKTFINTKDAELKSEFDEWLIRIYCFAFSINPQPFIKMSSRSTAMAAKDQAREEGLAPTQKWVKNWMNRIIENEFGFTDLEFDWLDDQVLDPSDQADVLVKYVSSGMKTINEARDELGMDPVVDGDEPMVLTKMGYAPLKMTPEMLAPPSPVPPGSEGGDGGDGGHPATKPAGGGRRSQSQRNAGVHPGAEA